MGSASISNLGGATTGGTAMTEREEHRDAATAASDLGKIVPASPPGPATKASSTSLQIGIPPASPSDASAKSAAKALYVGDDYNAYGIGTGVGRARMADMSLRSATVAFLAVSLGAMLTSTQHSLVNVIGLSFAISMKWNRTLPFRFLVVVDVLIGAYAFLQFVYQSIVFAKKSRPNRRHMWAQLVADQVCVYLVLAGAAAAAGAARMNKAGFHSLGLENLNIPTICSVLDKFCGRATIAIIFTFLAAFTSSVCTALDLYVLALTY